MLLHLSALMLHSKCAGDGRLKAAPFSRSAAACAAPQNVSSSGSAPNWLRPGRCHLEGQGDHFSKCSACLFKVCRGWHILFPVLASDRPGVTRRYVL